MYGMNGWCKPDGDLISRAAAIDAVSPLQTYKLSEGDDMLLVDKADVQMALMMLPSAQPYTDEEIQKMQDLEQAQLDKAYQIGVEEGLQSAQPEIIACGDCKHWICHDRRCGFWNHGVKPLDWCCHAERRTDG